MTTPAASSSEVPIRALRMVSARLLASGVDPRGWLAEVGLAHERLLDPSATMPRAAWLTAWTRADELTCDPALGVRIADQVPVQLFAEVAYETEYLVVQIAASSATVGDALARYARYHVLAGPELVVERREGASVLRLVRSDLPRGLAEMSLALFVKLARGLAVTPIALGEVRLARQAPADPSEHRRVLGNVRFGAREDSIAVPDAALAVALRSARPELLARLEAHADSLARGRRASTFADEVAAALEARLLARREPTAGAVARELGVSVRTLARRLGAERTTHRAVLDRVRAQLSQRYLEDDELAVKEIADRLGFADASAFHRAYRRWFGHPPAARGAHQAPRT